jgi:predicted ATPase
MYLRTLIAKNFRALTNIAVEFTPGVNVIVGPNATGKTTILEAIRLPKALLASRTSNEATQTLLALGAASPHAPQQIIAPSLAQNIDEPLEIRCGYQLLPEEITVLTGNLTRLVTFIVQERLGPNINPANFAAYISSPPGQLTLSATTDEVNSGIEKLKSTGNVCRLELNIDFKSGLVTTPDPMGASFVSFIDRDLTPDRTKFSYFPADRALPRGEQPIQLGSPDAGQQLEAHNSQPQTKYNRLKNTVFGTIIASENGRQQILDDFRTIFSGVLKGRELLGAGINQWGMLTTLVKDVESGRVFDIDAMSSGEKGLILTFLLIARTMQKQGVVLLDEPELHLNPAVCKDLLPFIIDNYSKPKELQLIICSHSPEILAGAFDRDECSLFHLVSGTMLTKIRRNDEDLITDALRRLGTSESEGLLYKATIFVEGEHDVELLEHGFNSLLKQYKLKDLGGRREVEKQIKSLQEAENHGEKLSSRYFIFDRDDAPSILESTEKVKVLQWDRRCLENYLIEIDILADLLMDKEISGRPTGNLGELSQNLKKLTMMHLDDAVIADVYKEFNFDHPGHRPSETVAKSFSEAGELLFTRIDRIKEQISILSREHWTQDFIRKCQARRSQLEPIWDVKWPELCDGKRLFKEIQKLYEPRMPLLSFKKRVLERMKATPPSENWRAIESLLKELIKTA